MGKNRIVESQELVDTQAILLSLVNVLVYCVLVELHCLRNLAVGHVTILVEPENLFQFTHVYWFICLCHTLLCL